MSNWEQETIQKVLLETIKEQRRARRWRVFFRLIVLVLIGWAVYASYGSDVEDGEKTGPQVAVVDFKGVIDGDNKNYATVIKGVTDALKDKKTVAVLKMTSSLDLSSNISPMPRVTFTAGMLRRAASLSKG